MGVAIFLLFARFYTRRNLIDAVQASDYMALLASVGTLSLISFQKKCLEFNCWKMFAVTFVGIFITGESATCVDLIVNSRS